MMKLSNDPIYVYIIIYIYVNRFKLGPFPDLTGKGENICRGSVAEIIHGSMKSSAAP